MPTLFTLATGENIIYIITRLFDYAEKIKAEDIEQAVKRGIGRALQDIGIVSKQGVRTTFVPFRDTTQKIAGNLSSAVMTNLNQTIYFEDIERLNRSFALIGFFDGLAKDEGICMEVGYAYGIERPVILVVTDFVRAGFKGVLNREHLLDPVITAMASKVIYQYNIPTTEAPFRTQLQEALEMLYMKVENETCLLCLESVKKNEENQQKILTPALDKYDVYIDFGGGLFEWQRILQDRLVEILLRRGLSCVISDRYTYYAKNANNKSILELGRREINKAQSSSVIVTCSDSTEMNSGTAALQGYSRALGKKVLLYDSKTINMVGDNQYLSSHNLMIDYSANRTVERFDDLPIAVDKLLKE